MNDTPLLLIQGAQVYAPEFLGVQDILVAGGRIAALAPRMEPPAEHARRMDGRGLLVVPGFIDAHVHILGGGGEGGFASRTPELRLGDAFQAGITTVVGCLGTDGVGRSLETLLAKARGLEEQGLHTCLLTGSYGVPPITLTGSVERDLILIDKIIGVGELAISDNRSSQPTLAELARIAGEARRGGLLSGKAGIVNIHLGDAPGGMDPLFELVATTGIPITQFLPTHVNRNPAVFDQALRFAAQGGFVDITTSGVPQFYENGTVLPARALRLLLEGGAPGGNVTFSSDGQGSLPRFAGDGTLDGLDVGTVHSLHTAFRDAVLVEGLPLEAALRAVTRNPARAMKLADRGRVEVGCAADLVFLHPEDLSVHTVLGGGRILVENGVQKVRGNFE